MDLVHELPSLRAATVNPQDPRHGTNAGYVAGCRDTCCRQAHATYRRSIWRNRYTRRVDRLYIDATGTQRRIRALQAIGWRYRDIDIALGHPTPQGTSASTWSHNIMRQQRIHVDNARAVAELYDRWSMTPGPSKRLRTRAAKWGWPTPFTYLNIDDPDEQPDTGYHAGRSIGEAPDPVVVDRILAGEVIPANAAERDEAMRRWRAAGNSERSLCVRMGWRDGRYGREERSA